MPEHWEICIPPIWDRIARTGKKLDKELIFKWINHRVLFRQRWGYKRGKQDSAKFLQYEKEVVEPTYEALKAELVDKDIFDPIAIYAYYPCISHDNKLYIFDRKYLFNSLEESKMYHHLKKL